MIVLSYIDLSIIDFILIVYLNVIAAISVSTNECNAKINKIEFNCIWDKFILNNLKLKKASKISEIRCRGNKSSHYFDWLLLKVH